MINFKTANRLFLFCSKSIQMSNRAIHKNTGAVSRRPPGTESAPLARHPFFISTKRGIPLLPRDFAGYPPTVDSEKSTVRYVTVCL